MNLFCQFGISRKIVNIVDPTDYCTKIREKFNIDAGASLLIQNRVKWDDAYEYVDVDVDFVPHDNISLKVFVVEPTKNNIAVPEDVIEESNDDSNVDENDEEYAAIPAR